MHQPTTSRLKPRLLAMAASVALLTAACGSEPDESAEPSVASVADAGSTETSVSSASEETDELTPEEANVAFEQCLADNGVENPFGGDSGESVGGEGAESQAARLDFDSEEEAQAFDEALNECNQIFEDAFGEFEASPEQEAEMADMEAAFEQCMADQGLAALDDGSYEVDDVEEFEAASSECEDILNNFNGEIVDAQE